MTQPDKLPDPSSNEPAVNETTEILQSNPETLDAELANFEQVDSEQVETDTIPIGDAVAVQAQDAGLAGADEESEDTVTPVSRVPQEQLEYSLSLAKAAVKAAAENRGQNILVLDLSEHTSLFDLFMIASGSSRRQLGAMCSEIERVLKTDFNERKLSVSGFDESRWIVLDYGSIVIHLFDEETRDFYDLESLWGDGKPVDIAAIVAQASAQMARFGE